MKKCEFGKAWIGLCNEPTDGDNNYCEEHIAIKCCSCGNQATKECSETSQFVCGFPLCNECEHTIHENGCNSGAPLPKGLKGHCKKSEQVYKPWYKRKTKIDIFIEPVTNLERGEEFTATIQKLKFNGKWVEFWFEENYPRISNNPDSYHQSSKIYKLQDAVHKSDIEDDVLTNGYKGKVITWQKIGNNYEIKSIK